MQSTMDDVIGEFRPKSKLLYALGLYRAPWASVWSLMQIRLLQCRLQVC